MFPKKHLSCRTTFGRERRENFAQVASLHGLLREQQLRDNELHAVVSDTRRRQTLLFDSLMNRLQALEAPAADGGRTKEIADLRRTLDGRAGVFAIGSTGATISVTKDLTGGFISGTGGDVGGASNGHKDDEIPEKTSTESTGISAIGATSSAKKKGSTNMIDYISRWMWSSSASSSKIECYTKECVWYPFCRD